MHIDVYTYVHMPVYTLYVFMYGCMCMCSYVYVFPTSDWWKGQEERTPKEQWAHLYWALHTTAHWKGKGSLQDFQVALELQACWCGVEHLPGCSPIQCAQLAAFEQWALWSTSWIPWSYAHCCPSLDINQSLGLPQRRVGCHAGGLGILTSLDSMLAEASHAEKASCVCSR